MSENTTMSEEVKVGLMDEATCIAIILSGQTYQVTRRERFWELDRNNSDVERDSSNESDTDESVGILSMLSCSAEHSLP